jgi:modulator of FtsH protease
MAEYSSGAWSDFAVAHVGASAALLGLVFLGITINLRAVIGSRHLVNRAAEAVLLLGAVLASSTLVLVPQQGRSALGIELLSLGALALALVLALQRGTTGSVRAVGVPKGAIAFRRLSGVGAPVATMAAGISLLAEAGGGLHWWTAAVLLAYVGSLTGAWVLLVEILR